jgi:hypothetical protein
MPGAMTLGGMPSAMTLGGMPGAVTLGRLARAVTLGGMPGTVTLPGAMTLGMSRSMATRRRNDYPGSDPLLQFLHLEIQVPHLLSPPFFLK